MKTLLTGTDDTRLFSAGSLPSDISYIPELLPDDVTTIGVSTVIHLTASTGMDRGFDHFEDFTAPSEVHGGNKHLKEGLAAKLENAPDTVNQLIHTGYRLWNCLRGNLPYPTVDRVTDYLEEVLPSVDGSAFIWIHLMEPHTPFLPIGSVREYGLFSVARTHGILETDQQRLSPDQRDFIRELYAARVEAGDRAVGQVIDCLRSHDRFEDSLIWVTADHGEELGDHGWFGHSHMGAETNCYSEICWIPSIVRAPGASIHDDSIYGQIDVAKSLCDWYGNHRGDLQGSSIFRASESKNVRWTMNQSKENSVVAATYDDRRYILETSAESTEVTEELYDLKTDAGMEDDLVSKGTKPDEEIIHEAKSRVDRLASNKDSTEADTSPQVNRQLRDLGYK